MKANRTMPVFLVSFLFLTSCAGEPRKIIIDPEASADPLTANPPAGQTADSLSITESQNGPAGAFIPDWVYLFIRSGIKGVEALGRYSEKYVFIAENRGKNFNALDQWVTSFTAEQDFSILVAARIEKRLLDAAKLYPDDEYGDFFESLIKGVSDAGYSGAVKEETFWIKRRLVLPEQDPAGTETAAVEIYDFFVLVSIDKIALQNRIRDLMENIVTTPTRDQAAAINNIRQSFSEGF
jgi:hypothetical protein